MYLLIEYLLLLYTISYQDIGLILLFTLLSQLPLYRT